MKKCIGITGFPSLLLALSMVLAAHSQEPTATIKVQVRLVEVYASVHDQKGHFVDGLSRENFQVLEDGQPSRLPPSIPRRRVFLALFCWTPPAA